jgi:hypothetical protein
MGHDTHFLERLDRVTDDQTELALSLYRDHEAVRLLLDHEAIPTDAPRIAIALADAPGPTPSGPSPSGPAVSRDAATREFAGGRERTGPFVIVARDGHFVTCLGAGMSPGPWPILPRYVLERSLSFAEATRHRKRIAEELAHPGEKSIISRIFRKKNMISREEISGLAALAPIYIEPFYRLARGLCAQLITEVAHAPKPRPRPSADAVDIHARYVWTCASAMELTGAVDPRCLASVLAESHPAFSFSSLANYLIDAPFLLRGAWAAGRAGTRILDRSLRDALEANALREFFDGTFAAVAIALRHPDAFGPTVKTFTDWCNRGATTPMDSFKADVLRTFTELLALREGVATVALAEARTRYLRAIAGKLKPGDLGYYEVPEEVPYGLAVTAALNAPGWIIEVDEDLQHVFRDLFLLTDLNVEAFHYPAEVLKKLETPWGEREVTRHFQLLDRAIGRKPKPETVRRETTVPRNAPCPCGSGKKAKRCCHG